MAFQKQFNSQCNFENFNKTLEKRKGMIACILLGNSLGDWQQLIFFRIKGCKAKIVINFSTSTGHELFFSTFFFILHVEE